MSVPARAPLSDTMIGETGTCGTTTRKTTSRGAAMREMSWADIPALARLEQQLFAQDAWTEQTWWRELAERPRREYVVVDDPAQVRDAAGAGVDEPAEATLAASARVDDPAHATVAEPAADGPAQAGLAAYGGIDVSGSTADVMTIAVAPGHQGTGLGSVMLEELLARARARGAEAMLLEVRADNDPAIRLYERRGFEVISTRRRYYQPGDVDALVMRAFLLGPATVSE